ncbi:hypothetical protein B0G62_101880 [Paraburkholderia eburnea]|uniref:Uncharacterized protein n=1 Tax=Paraburkholderia eburnea TaxID=1189126 RepID=A0A2S4MPF8_9BURK|nr:hypothetical protein B0G62_101880 [Paraburkholderia eburnea]PRZ27606.1 hypothetical protein BX588_101879 [Paraburkholderia eburnea]
MVLSRYTEQFKLNAILDEIVFRVTFAVAVPGTLVLLLSGGIGGGSRCPNLPK